MKGLWCTIFWLSTLLFSEALDLLVSIFNILLTCVDSLQNIRWNMRYLLRQFDSAFEKIVWKSLKHDVFTKSRIPVHWYFSKPKLAQTRFGLYYDSYDKTMSVLYCALPSKRQNERFFFGVKKLLFTIVALDSGLIKTVEN